MQCLPAEHDLLCLILWPLVCVDEPNEAGLRPVLLRVPLWILVQQLLQIAPQLQAGGCCVWAKSCARQGSGWPILQVAPELLQAIVTGQVLGTNRDAEKRPGWSHCLS